MSIEKRRFPRIDAVFTVLISEHKGEVITESKDISPGGISFYCDKHICEGNILKLELILEGVPGSIVATGKILRCIEMEERNHCAAVFLEIAPEDALLLEEYIREYRLH